MLRIRTLNLGIAKTLWTISVQNMLLRELKMEGKPAPVREDGDGRQSQSLGYLSEVGKKGFSRE